MSESDQEKSARSQTESRQQIADRAQPQPQIAKVQQQTSPTGKNTAIGQNQTSYHQNRPRVKNPANSLDSYPKQSQNRHPRSAN